MKKFSLNVCDLKEKVEGEVLFSVIGSDINVEDISNLYYLVNNYQKNHDRSESAAVKTRSQVKGGGAKPYRQKGTGRARRGTSRSPLIRGGGKSFGPTKRTYQTKLSAKLIKKAIRLGIEESVDKISILNLDNQSLKSKEFRNVFDVGRCLFIYDVENEGHVVQSFSNFKQVHSTHIYNIKIESILKSNKIYFTKRGLEKFVAFYNG